MTTAKQRHLDRAETIATRCADCPSCHLDTRWPEDTAALEATCECGHVLRLEPDGTIRDRGIIEAYAPECEQAADPDDLEAL